MLIIEIIIGFVCFFAINFVYDTYIKKAKSPLSDLGIISTVQTVIALCIYYVAT